MKLTYDMFLDNQKKRGFTIYRCIAKSCAFRGYGMAVSYHDMQAGHVTMDEDSEEYKNAKFANKNPIRSSKDMRDSVKD